MYYVYLVFVTIIIIKCCTVEHSPIIYNPRTHPKEVNTSVTFIVYSIQIHTILEKEMLMYCQIVRNFYSIINGIQWVPKISAQLSLCMLAFCNRIRKQYRTFGTTMY